MGDILFSVIVPCYNVQDYLSECVDSILAQSYENFELLLIDDGSSDDTAALCNAFGEKDARISVFHKENGGLSDARNYGMDRATGAYFVFVDGDDRIAPDALCRFYDVLRVARPDVLLTRLTEFYEPDERTERDAAMKDFFRDGVSEQSALIWEMTKSAQSWPAQKKIISKAFVDAHSLRFRCGFLHEDMDWSARVMMCAQTFAVSPAPWYDHRMARAGSITNTVQAKRLTDVLEMASDLIGDAEMRALPEDRRRLITNRLMASVYPILAFYGRLDADGKRAVLACCRKYRSIFRIAPKRKYRLFSLSARILGFRFSLWLLGHMGGIT